MSGATAATYIGGALLANTVYGAVTGEAGGLIGEAFGVQDKIDSQTAAAKQENLDRQSAQQAQQVASQKAAADAIEKAASSSLISTAPATTTAVNLGAATTTPAVSTPKVMPIAADTVAAAKRVSLAEMRRRQGRASTILTDTLGG